MVESMLRPHIEEPSRSDRHLLHKLVVPYPRAHIIELCVVSYLQTKTPTLRDERRGGHYMLTSRIRVASPTGWDGTQRHIFARLKNNVAVDGGISRLQGNSESTLEAPINTNAQSLIASSERTRDHPSLLFFRNHVRFSFGFS
jgi:hypothetical protein